MWTSYTPVGGREAGDLQYDHDDGHGQGLVTFAGIVLMIAALLNPLDGIAAIDSANVFVHKARYVFGDPNTWGWSLVELGVLQFFTAFDLARCLMGWWFGVACASANAILQMLWIPGYPLLALTILPLEIIAIYGLPAYGGRRRSAREVRARAQGRVAS